MGPEKYVVRVFGKTTNGMDYNGTGFLLNSNGTVATCWHVVRDAGNIFVQLPYTQRWDYEVFDKQEQQDVAILRPLVPPAIETAYATLHPDWFERDKIGDEVHMYGYSNAENVDAALRFKCNISGVSNQYGLIMLDGHVNRGDSGGPLLNLHGDVIGIANFRDSEREGHAMARPISRLYKLLLEKQLTFGVRIGSGKLAERAFVSLVKLINDRRVRDAVKGYGAIFERASRQISTLHAYKQVHDLLFKVEFACYNIMVVDARDFPHDESARDKMIMHLDNLRRYVDDAEVIVSEAVERRDRIEKVRDQLKGAYQALDDAERLLSLSDCNRALNLLDKLLSRAQSIFNVLLNEVARELDMQSLVGAMQSLQETISSMELPSETVESFKLGVTDLDQLRQDLHERIQEHDNWQQVDESLRAVNRNSPDLLSEVEAFWPLINSYLDIACKTGCITATVTKPIELIIMETSSVQAAFAQRDFTLTRRHFGSLLKQAADRLDRVDQKLLGVCKKITEVRTPLRTLVENLT